MINKFLPYWKSLEGPHPRIRMLFMDHHVAHMTDRVLEAMIEARTILVKIPKSMTAYLQSLDVHVFTWMRRIYQQHVDKFLAENVDHICSAMEKRVFTLNFSARSFAAIDEKFRYLHCFEQLGYINVGKSTSPINLHGMQMYRYEAAWEPASDVKEATEKTLAEVRIAFINSVVPRAPAAGLPKQRPIGPKVPEKKPMKQMTLVDMFKKRQRDPDDGTK
jgi:hypothetical protein